MLEKEFIARVVGHGGRAFVAGGWVRDNLLGKAPQDKDYVVTGFNRESFGALFPEGQLIGRAFPVFLMEIDGRPREVALARHEKKQGRGYRGFAAEASAAITIEEDLYRRDLTVNSMAMDLQTGELIDPYGGQQDLADKILQPVSKHFGEDPVRALRCARFGAQLGFEPVPELLLIMYNCLEELSQEPQERLLGELKKALATEQPERFFRLLQAAGLLEVTFPELHALIGKTQPVVYHPEGDAFEHTMLILAETAANTDNVVARFAALCHDLGKGVTPESMLPHHYGHEVKGRKVLKDWNHRMTLPGRWMKAADFIISQHMRAPRLAKPGKIVELLLAMHKISTELPISDIKIIIRADNKGLPFYLEQAEEILSILLSVSGKDAPSHLTGKQIGQWVQAEQLRLFRVWLSEHK